MVRTRPIFKIFLLFLLAVFSCAPSNTSGPDSEASPPEDGAVSSLAGRTLRLYTALDENEIRIYAAAFEEETGVRVKWVRLATGELLARLRAEKNRPQMDVWIGGSSPDFIAAAREGLLAPHRPDLEFDPDPKTHDPDWLWTGFYFGALGFASNKEFLEERGVPAPESWNDLLRPEFKNEVSMAYAYTSGTAYSIVAALAQMMGEEEAMNYMERLDRQIHHYNKSGSACVTQVGLGEIAVGIAYSHDVLKKGPSKGYPVVLTFPKEGTGYEIGGVALLKGGPDPGLGKRFLDWIVTERAQNLMRKWFRIPLNPNAKIAEGAVRAADVKLAPFDDVRAGRDKKRLVERWRRITGQ